MSVLYMNKGNAEVLFERVVSVEHLAFLSEIRRSCFVYPNCRVMTARSLLNWQGWLLHRYIQEGNIFIYRKGLK